MSNIRQEIRGWNTVFYFTFQQKLKNRYYQFFLMITLLLCLVTPIFYNRQGQTVNTDFFLDLFEKSEQVNKSEDESKPQLQIFYETCDIEDGKEVSGLPGEDNVNRVLEVLQPMGIAFVLYAVILAVTNEMLYSVVDEKTTRVSEFVNLSVRPLAIMIGKVLSAVISVLLVVGAGAVLSKISEALTTGAERDFSRMISVNFFGGASMLQLILGGITVCMGIIGYAVYAALLGASIDRIQDAPEMSGKCRFLLLFGEVMVAVAVIFVMRGEIVPAYLVVIFPLTAPLGIFALMGNIGNQPWIFLISFIAMSCFLLVLLFFTVKKYEAVYMFRGVKVNLRDILFGRSYGNKEKESI